MFKKFSKFEDVLINKFNQHPLWAQLPKRSNAFFIRLLLQLGCISNHFVMWYEQAKLGINIEFGKETLVDAPLFGSLASASRFVIEPQVNIFDPSVFMPVVVEGSGEIK